MTSAAHSSASPAGIGTTLRAGLNAGLMNGLLFGLLDGVIAGTKSPPGGFVAWVGCLGLAVLTYGIVWTLVILPLAAVLHPWLRSKDLYRRMGLLLTLAVGLGIFLELYWWTRPYVYSGLSARDPKRLAFAGALLLGGLAFGFAGARLTRFLPRALRMAATIAVPLLWIAGGAYLFSLRSATSARGELNSRNRDMPNVLLVVCDALRADMLGCYDNKRVKTPVLDDLAARGVLFENAIVTAPFTWASFGSMLTGKYPRRHGLVKIDPRVRMRKENVTLPWHLKSAVRSSDGVALQDEDFISATFMTGTLSHGSGLARGFDIYYEALVGHDVVDTASPWSIFRSNLVLSILRDKLAQSFDSSRVVSVANEWLDEHRGRRFVSMVHLYSTHTPYNPPQKFRDQYCDPSYQGPVHTFWADHSEAIEKKRWIPTDADKLQIRNLYEAGVAQADEMIGELIEGLRQQGALDQTLVIVTADHGEELGEHGVWEHDWHYQTNLLVPWLMSWPAGLPAGKRVAEGVQLIDLLPTVTDLLRVGLPKEASGTDPEAHIDGVSLLPLIRGEQQSVRAHAFAENEYFMSVQDTGSAGPRFKLIIDARVDCATALTTVTEKRLRPELYRLDEDPNERKNIVKSEPEQAARLLEVLCAWDASMPIPHFDILESDRDTRARAQILELLGYGGK